MSQNVSFGIFWISLSLVNAGLAQGRNRDAWQWWLASLFVGPLATALIVVWPAVQRRAGDRGNPDGGNPTEPDGHHEPL